MKKDINILYRSDGKAVSIDYYNYSNAFNIKCFDIAKLNFNNIDNIKNNQLNLTKISIYDFRSKKALDRIPYTSNRCTHSQEHTYSITDLREFVNSLLIKYSNIKDLRF